MELELEWDEPKRRQIMEERGFDILDAVLILERDVITNLDRRQNYGEVRWRSVGLIDGECFVVIYTRRGSAIRLITAWRGGRRERARYQASLARRNQEDEGAG